MLTRVADSDVKAPALELKCDDPHNATATYITCPRDPAHSIGTKLQCIVLIVKNVSAHLPAVACVVVTYMGANYVT